MHTTTLREVGDSIMLAVPSVLLDQLQLKAGETVVVDVEDGRLIVEANLKSRPRYTLAELLDISDYSQPQPPEEREWVDAGAVGGELL